jgi:hypothetical protein
MTECGPLIVIQICIKNMLTRKHVLKIHKHVLKIHKYVLKIRKHVLKIRKHVFKNVKVY